MRNRNWTLATAAAVLLALPVAASAGGKSGRFAVEDMGQAKCSAFLKARTEKSPAYHSYVGFIEGYVTAANRYEPNTFDLTPWHNAEAFGLILAKNCATPGNRDASLAMVAQELVAAMRPLRLADYSDKIAIREGGSRAEVYQTILKRAQLELTRKGLFHGTPDGTFSPDTKLALQEFQKTAKLDPTGVPDAATLWVLLNP
jgi:hypothetical protein